MSEASASVDPLAFWAYMVPKEAAETMETWGPSELKGPSGLEERRGSRVRSETGVLSGIWVLMEV